MYDQISGNTLYLMFYAGVTNKYYNDENKSFSNDRSRSTPAGNDWLHEE